MWHLRYDFIDNEVYSWFYWSSTTRKDNRNAAELKIYTKKIRLDFIPNDEKLNCEPKRKKNGEGLKEMFIDIPRRKVH